ncbi:MAG: transglutaminase family protein [Alphaproteobacteria bacterium]|nr:transglutaminase family protein [Alphaproteobacteria bacterium]
MTRLHIQHVTTYRYPHAVRLGQHTLMLRPRQSRDVHVLSSALSVSPSARIAWSEDVNGNAVASASFAAATDNLTIACVSEIELGAVAWPVFEIAYSAASYPFRYSDDDWVALGALTAPSYADPDGRLAQWARGFVRGNATDTLSLLKDICAGIGASIRYQSRDEEGTQSACETLDRGWGTCRDLATLFVDAVRSLGFGARIVSGYLYDPDFGATGNVEAGNTHAWAEVFVPGAGWIAFDPTNGGVGGFNLVPVAVARSIHQVMPVTGSLASVGGAAEMAVAVSFSRSPLKASGAPVEADREPQWRG